MRPSRSLRRLRQRAPSLSRSSRFHPRGLSLSLPLDIAPPLFSSRTFSLFHPPPPRPLPPFPFPSRSFGHVRPVPVLSRPLGLLSRSSLVARPSVLLSSPFPFVSARPPLFSRHSSSFGASLSAAAYNHPLAARSVLIESATNPARHLAVPCIFAFFSLALATLSDAPSLSLSVSELRYFSLPFSLRFVSLFFPRHLFRSFRPCPSPTNALSLDVYVSSGVWYTGRTSYERVRVRACAPPRLSFSRSSRRGRRKRACSNRFDTRSRGGKKMGGCIVGACHRGV